MGLVDIKEQTTAKPQHIDAKCTLIHMFLAVVILLKYIYSRPHNSVEDCSVIDWIEPITI